MTQSIVVKLVPRPRASKSNFNIPVEQSCQPILTQIVPAAVVLLSAPATGFAIGKESCPESKNTSHATRHYVMGSRHGACPCRPTGNLNPRGYRKSADTIRRLNPGPKSKPRCRYARRGMYPPDGFGTVFFRRCHGRPSPKLQIHRPHLPR